MQETVRDSEKLVYKPREAAKVLHVSPPVMYALCKREDFPAVHIGRAIVIPKAALERWLDTQAASGQNVVV